jgi:hypothetical protein
MPLQAAMARNYIEPTQHDTAELTQYYKDLSVTAGETAVRQDIARRSYEADRTQLSQAMMQELQQGNVEYAKQHAWNMYSLQQDKYSVEKLAQNAAQELAVSNPEWGPIVAQWATRGDKNLFQIANDLYLKEMQFTAAVEELKRDASMEKNGFFNWATDMLGAFFHPHESLEKAGTWWSAGDDLANMMMELRALPAGPQFDAGLDNLISTIKQDAGLVFNNKWLRAKYAQEDLNIFSTAGSPELVGDENFWNRVNTLALLPIPKIGKLRGMFTTAGAKELSAKEVAQILTSPPPPNADAAVHALGAEAVEDLIALRKPGAIPEGISTYAKNALEENQNKIDSALSATKAPSRLTQPEELTMREAINTQLKGEYGDSLLHDATINYDPDLGGIDVVIDLGTKKGVPYTNMTTAHSVAQRRGMLKGTYEVVESPSGGYVIRTKRALSDTGYIEPYAATDVGVSTVTGSLIRNPATWVPRATGWMAKVATQAQRGLEMMFEKVLEPINKLGYHELKLMDDVLKFSRNINDGKGKWLDYDELERWYQKVANRLPKDKETIAYYAYKQAADAEWSLRNDALYRELLDGEYKEVIIDGYAMMGGKVINNGKVVTGTQGMDRIDRVYDATTDTWTKIGEVDVKALDPQYKTLVKLYTPVHVNKHPVKMVIVDNDQLAVNALNQMQLKYAAGGHRMYRGKWFVKQLHVAEYPDGGKYIGVPRTFLNAESKNVAAKAANEWNMVIDALKEYRAGIRSPEEFDSMVKRFTNYSGIDDFLDEVSKGHIVEDGKFHVFFDREPTFEKAMLDMRGKQGEYINATGSLDAHVEWYNSTGRMYYSARHEPLMAPTGNDAPVLDSLEAIRKSSLSATNTWAFSNFKNTEVSRWNKTYGHLVERSSLPPNPSPYEIFRYGVIDEQYRRTDPDLFAKATATRGYLNRVFGTPTTAGERVGVLTKRIGEWIEKTFPESEIAKGRAEWLYSNVGSNPQGAVKGLMYDAYLGMLNVGQVLLQAMGAVNGMAIHPVYGLRASAEYLALRGAMMNTSPAVWEKIAIGMAKMGDLTKDQYLQMIKDYRSSYLNSIGREIADLDTGQNIVGSHLRQIVSEVRSAGRIPVYEGERISRGIAYNIAWRDWYDYAKKNNLPKEMIDNPRRHAEYALARAEEYMQSMTTADATWWQRAPILGLTTQFWQFPMKLTENLLWPGRNKMFSGQERLRMLIGQAVLFGAAGVPFGQAGYNWFLRATGVEMDEETYKTISTGVIDKMIREVSDGTLDPAIGNYFGSGNFFADMLWSMFGDKSFAEVAGGVSITYGNKLLDAAQNIAYLSSLEQVGSVSLTNDIITEMSQLFTSARQFSKAYFLWNYGVYLNNTGSHIEMNKWNALLVAMNYPIAKVQSTFEMFKEQKGAQEGLVKDVGKMLATARIKAIETGNKRYYDLVQALLQPLPFQQRMDVINYANRLVPKDMYMEALEKQIKRASDPTLPGVNRAIVPEAYR